MDQYYDFLELTSLQDDLETAGVSY
jgi:hypothetical protein